MCSGDNCVWIAVLKFLHGHIYAVGAETLAHGFISVKSSLLDRSKAGEKVGIFVIHIETKDVDLDILIYGGHLYTGDDGYMVIFT